MTENVTIAIDAMGGDAAPDFVIDGLEIAREQWPDAHFLIFGDENRIAPLLDSHPDLGKLCTLRHTEGVVESEDRPSHALRHGQDTSMGRAIRAVRDGEAAVAVSAGNTGALMALSMYTLRKMERIDRPALAAPLPTLRGESVMLDLGANIECTVDNLVQFAVMGAAYARTMMGIQKPTVGLLNVGVEELKGNETVKAAAQILRSATLPFDFAGYIEGGDINQGTVDVIVSDGFTGNIALKSAEGAVVFIRELFRQAFANSFFARLGYLLVRRSLRQMRRRLDPNNNNGGVFLGLNGLVVKSHGGASARGFAAATLAALEMAREDLCSKISDDLADMSGHPNMTSVAS